MSSRFSIAVDPTPHLTAYVIVSQVLTAQSQPIHDAPAGA